MFVTWTDDGLCVDPDEERREKGMDNHIRDELAQTVRKARASIQAQGVALDHTALGWLVTFGQDWEAMQRQTTAWTKIQGWRIRNHLINAYLRKVWQWYINAHGCCIHDGIEDNAVTYITEEVNPCHDADC